MCTLLSGGLDSSVITALAAQGLAAAGQGPVHVDHCVGVLEPVDQGAYRGPEAVLLVVHVLGEELAHIRVVLEQVGVEVGGDLAAVGLDDGEAALDESGIDCHARRLY
ncbi:asparagine synthase-related protein [Kitasatospora cineracea]|uniref:asparagine synthase-related protein n=1 Tax=Kitasatospora cineracea TaxID=88074 RepID=UPI003F4D6BEC